MLACSRERRGGGLGILLFGMLTGMVAGLLLAPKPGIETLEDLTEKKDKLLDSLISSLPV